MDVPDQHQVVNLIGAYRVKRSTSTRQARIWSEEERREEEEYTAMEASSLCTRAELQVGHATVLQSAQILVLHFSSIKR